MLFVEIYDFAPVLSKKVEKLQEKAAGHITHIFVCSL